MTANSDLLDEAITLGLVLDALAQNSFGLVLARLTQLSDDLAMLTVRLDPTAVIRDANRRARLEILVDQASQMIAGAYADISVQVSADLDGVAELSQDSLSEMLALLLLIKGLSRRLDDDALAAAHRDTLVSGATVDDWWRRQSADMQFRTARALESAMRLSQIGKEPRTGDLVNAIRETGPGSLFTAAPRNAEGLIRSAHHAVASRVRFETAIRHPELFRALQHLSVLDQRTCLVSGTMLKTPHGERQIDQIKSGENVIGGSGLERKVLRTMSKPVKKLAKVTMDDGTVIFCTPDHLFLIENEPQSWREAQDLRIGEEVSTVLK